MVDAINIGQVNSLYDERRNINVALAYLAAGGRIEQMMVAPSLDTGDMPSATRNAAVVATGFMQYPQAMVDTIRSELEKRRSEINQELGNLGVTGLGE